MAEAPPPSVALYVSFSSWERKSIKEKNKVGIYIYAGVTVDSTVCVCCRAHIDHPLTLATSNPVRVGGNGNYSFDAFSKLRITALGVGRSFGLCDQHCSAILHRASGNLAPAVGIFGHTPRMILVHNAL